MKSNLRTILCCIFVASGFLQIAGYLSGVKALRGLGATYTAAPLPLVFTEVKGVETFASSFRVDYETIDGRTGRVDITPEFYGRLKGPYNWRNVYGAAFSYGPILPPRLTNAVLRHGFCRGNLTKDIDLGADIKNIRVLIQSHTRGPARNWEIKLDCSNSVGGTKS